MRPLRVRKPLPGNEVEAETVTQSALQLLEMIDWYGSEHYIIDVLTDPARPGLFSPALAPANLPSRSTEAALHTADLLRPGQCSPPIAAGVARPAQRGLSRV